MHFELHEPFNNFISSIIIYQFDKWNCHVAATQMTMKKALRNTSHWDVPIIRATRRLGLMLYIKKKQDSVFFILHAF